MKIQPQRFVESIISLSYCGYKYHVRTQEHFLFELDSFYIKKSYEFIPHSLY